MPQYKNRNSWWVDFRFQGKRYRLRSPDDRREGARKYEQYLRAKLAEGQPVYLSRERPHEVEPAAQPFDAFAQRWLEEYAKINVKPSTFKGYSFAVHNHLAPFFRTKVLAAINTEDVERFKRTKLAEGLSPKAVNNRLSILRRCLTTALEWEHIKKLPTFRWLKVPPAAFDHLIPAESAKLLVATDGSRWSVMVRCALRTGMRLGELLALKWEDVDFERNQILVRRAMSAGIECSPKNNRIRVIAMTTDLRGALETAPREGKYVFVGVEGAPRSPYTAEEALARLCRKAGLRHMGWHVLRHTFASQLATAGVPLATVQHLLGHQSIVMTERYAHLAPSAMKGVVNVLLEAERSGSRVEDQPGSVIR